MNRISITVIVAFTLMVLSVAADPMAQQPDVEAVSLDGRSLSRPLIGPDRVAELSEKLDQARADYAENPSADNLIWVARRTAYLSRYREAIEYFSRGIEAFPEDPRFLRHRGHRYITTRQFERAVEDLTRAAGMVAGRPDQVEPDGLPNARGIPLSTLAGNIWYHLGLAHYLLGDYESALDAYRNGLKVAGNPDMMSAFRYWLYLTQMRLGRQVDAVSNLAAVGRRWEIIENHTYHRLLLLFRGDLDPSALTEADGDALDNATLTYGLAYWHRLKGRNQQAKTIIDNLLATDQWASFAYIAAEADRFRDSQP